MPLTVTSLAQLLDHGFDTLIDVRSPAEFSEDHIPGAESMPAFSNEQRAKVGTIYKQVSAFDARKVGAAILARNVADHLDGALADKDGSWRPVVYCWRGGQRSGGVATILRQIGWRAETIEGGYKTYRRLVSKLLYDTPMAAPVVLLDGLTGTAKTAVLHRLADRAQVIDLEGLANHRGSALGGQGVQPSQKAFETALAQQVVRLDPTRPVLIEAESSKIGDLALPPRLFEAMRAAPRIEIRAPIEARAAYLARAYRDVTEAPDLLVARLQRLVRLQGRDRVSTWVELARAGAFEALAEDLMRHHYDPRYTKSRVRNDGAAVSVVEADNLSETALDDLASRVERQLASPTLTMPINGA